MLIMLVPKIFRHSCVGRNIFTVEKYFWCLSEMIMVDFTVEYERESCIHGHHIYYPVWISYVGERLVSIGVMWFSLLVVWDAFFGIATGAASSFLPSFFIHSSNFAC